MIECGASADFVVNFLEMMEPCGIVSIRAREWRIAGIKCTCSSMIMITSVFSHVEKNAAF